MQHSETAFLEIRKWINSGEMKLGDPIVEQDIATKLSISRTPIREALKKLEAEGYVITIPNRGSFVKELTSKDIVDIMQMREALEGMTARLACEKITKRELDEIYNLFPSFDHKLTEEHYDEAYLAGEKLHDFLIIKSGNFLLKQHLNLLHERILRARVVSAMIPGRYIKGHMEHKLILDALYNRDPELTEKQMRYHVEQTKISLLMT